MIAYIDDEKGRHDIRLVSADYKPEANETVVEGDDLSTIKTYRIISYSEMRAKEYPPMADYLDAIVKDDTAAIEVYKQACLAVKAKYPKGQTFRVEE